ncbi:MAG TPA: tetratricopeptide repeat protein [Candidatus Hydrogenedentes bacterium]|nr:tetratricopeptide repeat protein [Candidatus Hydrogenedentota bacterium]
MKQKFREGKRRYKRKEYVESLKIFEKLAEAFPQHKEITYMRARCLTALRRPGEAWALCEKLSGNGEVDPRIEKLKAKLTAEPPPFDSSSLKGPPLDGLAFETPPPPVEPRDAASFEEPSNEPPEDYLSPVDVSEFTRSGRRARRVWESIALVCMMLASLGACGGVLALHFLGPELGGQALAARPAAPIAVVSESTTDATEPIEPVSTAPVARVAVPSDIAPERTPETAPEPKPQPAVPAVPSVPPPPARIVAFSLNVSPGKLRTRQWGSTDDAWERLAEARGRVRVPAGLELRLDVVTVDKTDLSFLNTLESDTLQGLSLARAKITDADLTLVTTQRGLTWLDLHDTAITDNGLAHLKSLSRLQSLNLVRTRVTDAGIAELKKALPHCTIIKF